MPSRAAQILEALDSGLVYASLKLKQEQQSQLQDGTAQYQDDPVGFVTTRLGEFLWSKQREICQAVVDYPRVVVPSAFNVGKSRVASRICAWWLTTRPFGEAFVVTTAPTASQVRAILWREIGRAYWSGKLPGRLNQTEWWMAPGGDRYSTTMGGEELVAVGRKSSDYDEHSFQGLHQRYLLVVIDEGAGVAPSIYDAAESLASNDDSRILVIGNPTDPQSKMSEITTRPGSRWKVVTIDAYESPNWTGEPVPEGLDRILLSKRYAQTVAEDSLMVQPGEPVVEAATCGLCPIELPRGEPLGPHMIADHFIAAEKVDEAIRQTGGTDITPESPTYSNRVRGRFTADDPDSIVPLSYVRRCQLGDKEWTEQQLLPVELGCDVGAGGDEFVLRERRGPKVGRKWGITTKDWKEAVELSLEAIKTTGATCIKVDVIGIGWGVAGRLDELYREGKHLARVVSVNVGSQSLDPTRFPKLRDQVWWDIGRELTISGGWDLTGIDEATVAQLCAPRKVPDSAGRIKVEPKETTRERLHRSPDDADALLLAYYSDSGRAFNVSVVGERMAVIPPGRTYAASGAPVINGNGADPRLLLGEPIKEGRRGRNGERSPY